MLKRRGARNQQFHDLELNQESIHFGKCAAEVAKRSNKCPKNECQLLNVRAKPTDNPSRYGKYTKSNCLWLASYMSPIVNNAV